MPDTRLRIERLDGSLLEIEAGPLTEAFFANDRSSKGCDSFDALAGRTASPDGIVPSDLAALNRTMRTRSRSERWAAIWGVELPWLKQLDPKLDLIETDEAAWQAAEAEQLLQQALTALVAQGLGLAVTTKMLHLKRPRLFPMIDRLVAEALAFRPGSVKPGPRAELAHLLVLHLRTEGRRNIKELRATQDRLQSKDVARSLVRMLDAALWSSHPASLAWRRRVFATAADDEPRSSATGAPQVK